MPTSNNLNPRFPMKRFLSLFLAIGLAGLSFAAEKVDALQVEVLVFSGRPNPRLVVSDPALIREITAAVAALPRQATLAVKDTALPSKLGYRGFRVENASASSPELAAFVVHGAVVEALLQGAGGLVKEVRLDAGASLESRLLQLAEASGRLEPAVLEHIKARKSKS